MTESKFDHQGFRTVLSSYGFTILDTNPQYTCYINESNFCRLFVAYKESSRFLCYDRDFGIMITTILDSHPTFHFRIVILPEDTNYNYVSDKFFDLSVWQDADTSEIRVFYRGQNVLTSFDLSDLDNFLTAFGIMHL